MKYEQKIRTKTEQKEESVNVLWRELEETEQEQTRGGVDFYDPLGLLKLFSIQIGMPKFLKGSGKQGRGNGEYPI